jgi:cystathionine beta-lyase
MAPLFQSPLALGAGAVLRYVRLLVPALMRLRFRNADISMTSATKFIAGHSDLMAGVLAVRGEELAKEIYFHQNAEGTALAPFDCWLTLRGLKTMALRMNAAQANAVALAQFLAGHPLVKRVNFPGLAGHPGAAQHAAQASGPGSILSFETGNLEASKLIVERTKLFKARL